MGINFYDYVSKYDFVPFAQLLSSEDFNVGTASKANLISSHVKEAYQAISDVKIEFKPETLKKGKTILKFKLQKAHMYASDPDGYLRYKLTTIAGQEFVSNHKNVIEHDLGEKKYGDIIEIEFSKNLMETVHFIDFYFKDNTDAWFDFKGDLPDSWEHCGRVTIGAGSDSSSCYCNRDFTEEEMIELIYNLRDKQHYIAERDSFFNKGNEYISSIRIEEGKLNDNRDKIKLFLDEMNSMFKTFKINTCKRKIHFIGQMYLETVSFRYTYESRSVVPGNYKGGVAFQGRGMKQITHDYNYLAYYDYVNNTNYKSIYDKFSLKDSKGNIIESVGQCVTNSSKANEQGLNDDFYENLKIFARKISEDLFHSFNSAGWYSTIYRKKVIAAMDKGLLDENIKEVTYEINGGDNGLAERTNFTKWTKDFFKYDTKCINR